MTDSSLNTSGLIFTPIEPCRFHTAEIPFVKDGVGNQCLLSAGNLHDLRKAAFPASGCLRHHPPVFGQGSQLPGSD